MAKYTWFKSLQEAIDEVDKSKLFNEFVIKDNDKFYVLNETEYMESPFSDEQIVYTN